MRSVYFLNLFIASTFATEVVHDEPYFKHTNDNVQIIYTKENIKFAEQTNVIEPKLHQHYQHSFDWKLDETLYVGLLSHRNQIANGYSTQWPNNRQINFMGGAQNIDYFCSTSWLDTLLYHESAHNYQVNVKGNIFSRFIHSIFGNGFMFFPLPLSVPNVMENSFMLEGNAVLNESWHGNGGRLYSGRFKAQTILQAKAGKITPQNVYNTTLDFPYGETYYLTGGFYQLYMAQKHGLDNLNQYFRQHSELFIWPQLTNASMQEVTGKDFESSLSSFAQEYASYPLELAQGDTLFSSQFYYPLNSNEDEIFFITNETAKQAPSLIRIEKKTLKSTEKKGGWIGSKVIKKDNTYYTLASHNHSAFNIYQGLFDEDASLLLTTKSKIVQGYLSNKKIVYFDAKKSFSQAQLYIENTFYDQVNSSVLIDKEDNLYYFKQKGKTRTLYKNKKALYSYEGFYGIVNDVDSQGAVYFVANSKNGSTLFKYFNADVKRVSKADNIIEAKLINDKKVFLSTIGTDAYHYIVSEFQEIKQSPYNTTLFFENKDYYNSLNYNTLHDSKKDHHLDLDTPYYSFLDMHYNGSNLFIESTQQSGLVGSLSMNFGDPLGQNNASAFINRNDSNITIAGLSYGSKQYLIKYSLIGYGVLDDDERQNTRDSGIMANANIPFIRQSYYYGDLSLSYFQDYDTLEREPLSLSLKFSRYEQYAKSMYPNYLNAIELYAIKERDDTLFGAQYQFTHDLDYEFYISLEAKHSQTDLQTTQYNAYFNTRGVKISNFQPNVYDKSQIYMPNILASYYLKNASYGGVQLTKVINFSKYFFTFPLSIQRESLYTKYRYYELEDFSQTQFDLNEITLGISLSLVGLNSLTFPLNIDYIYNDDDSFLIQDAHRLRIQLGINF